MPITPVYGNARNDYGGGHISAGTRKTQQQGGKSGGGGGSDDSQGSSTSSITYGAEAAPGSFKRGGKVRKTGLAKVHKGERVLTAKQDNKRKSKGRRKGRSKSR